MTVINTNTGSLYAQQAMNTNARGLSTVMQQLSTGKRINNAVDDVAGLAISTRLTSQIKGLNQAVRNANDGISLIQTAEGATEQITNMLQRMRELAIQATNDTNNSNDRGFLNGEFQQLKAEIDRIAQNTQWNGANILDGTGGTGLDGKLSFQVGANANQTVSITLNNLGTGIADPAASATMTFATVGTTTATFDFATGAASLDGNTATATNAAKYLGVTFEASIAGKKIQYQISQADLDAYNNVSGGGQVLLSKSVSAGLLAKVKASLGTGYTYVDNSATAGNFTVTAAGTTAALATNSIAIKSGSLSAIGGSSVNITTGTLANTTLGNIDSAMQTVNQNRSNMGAIISRLQFASDNLTNIASKATESRSRIEDTDYSVATTELAKRNIIQQAAQAMLAQANQAPQMVLQLLK